MVGLEQGLVYSLGLESHKAVNRIFSYERGEIVEGEFKAMADQAIDDNISYFGHHLENDWFIHQIPSLWSFNETGISFMKTAIEYRIENPRRNEARMKSILDRELSEQFLKDQLDSRRNKKGELYISEEEATKLIEESFQFKKDTEMYYQKAINHVKQLNKESL